MIFLLIIAIHPAKRVEIVLLITKKKQISIKYLNFLNIFLEKKALVLLKVIKLN